MGNVIYLDHAAATPLDDEVLAVMKPYFSDRFHNPSAIYLGAREAKAGLEDARSRLAFILGAKPGEITFTAGCSEANNLAIHGMMRRFPDKKIIVSAIEHESVLEPARAYQFTLAPANNKGIVDLNKLEEQIDDDTVMLSIMYANNELGSIQPLHEISALVENVRTSRAGRKVDTPLYLHTDAAQAANYLDMHVSRLGVDMMSMNGSKTYAQKQTGALYIKAGIELEPLIHGGGQEHGLRGGTENVAGYVGLAAAFEKAQRIRKNETRRLADIHNYFVSNILKNVRNARINGGGKAALPNIVNVTVPGIDGERAVMMLDEAGVQAATGAACSALRADEASHVLQAIGLSAEEAKASVRFSFGRSTNQVVIESALPKIIRVLKQL